jgi:hypothetical protein
MRFENSRFVQRRITHGYDLSAWLTQPCVIVIGQMQQADPAQPPVPLFVSTGGSFREVKSSGRTLVRWIYPLPADPPRFVSREAEPEQPASEGTGGPL